MRKSIKKLLAVALAATMAFSTAACNKGGSSDATTQAAQNQTTQAATQEEKTTQAVVTPTGSVREILIGTWWLQYYDSSHSAVEDDPSYSGTEASILKFENVAKIESKYNCKFYWTNLTYEGVKESINLSILAGTPDCDIYLVELGMAIPAAANGLCTDLKTVLPADHDLFTTQKVARYMDLGDGKACIIKRVEAASTVENTYPLGFNKQLLDANNLEDPRELYARGEWTWDKFIEYCQVLTQDTDGDGAIDQYGYCGFAPDTIAQLLMSNGGEIAATTTQKLDSQEVAETLQLVQDMYNTYNVAYPYEHNEKVMRYVYRTGKIGFWPCAAWILGENKDYDPDGNLGVTLEFDTVFVQWPVGPSGNQATNKAKVSGGEFYIIPAGVKDPASVFGVLYDMWNWYDGDETLRDDPETLVWWYTVTSSKEEIQDANFAVMYDCGSREQFDLWDSLGVNYSYEALISGEMTPAQYQETHKQEVQDALDAYFN